MRDASGMWFGVKRAFALIRHLMATGLLLLALLLLEAITGCEEADEPVVLYGPPPQDAFGEVDPDGVLPPDARDEMPNVYYGPPPTDVVEDAPPPDIQPDQPNVYYGPPPTDVVEDAPPQDTDPDQPAVLYGPMPTDVVEEGTPPDVNPDCPPVALYGPPPCDNDDDCVQWYGEGWVCDKEASFPDGCGGTTTWASCVEKK